MKQIIQRNTVQCDLVLNAVRSLCNHPTPEQVYSYIAKSHPSVSKSTVYRNLDKLCESGALLRIPVPGGALHVDHTLTSHYHMYCKVCGNLYDIEAAGIGDLKNEVTVSNGCEITDCYIVFSGTCPECNKADKN